MSKRFLCVLVSALSLQPACGGSGDSPFYPSDRAVPLPPVLTPLPSLSFAVPAGGSVRLDFDGPEAASLFATLDWQDPGNKLVATFTGRGCHSVNDALAGLCTDSELQSSRSDCAAKPRTLTAYYWRPVALRLWIANLGPSTESGHVDLLQCTDAPNCGASASCAQCIAEALRRRSCK